MEAVGRWLLSALFILTVVPAALVASPASAAPAIQLSRASAAAGDRIVVRGSGYTQNTTVTVSSSFYVNGAPRNVQVGAHTDAKGNFVATLPVPAGAAPGSYRVTATSGTKEVASQHLALLPVVNVRPGKDWTTTAVARGHYFFVRGSGFHPGETVQIKGVVPLTSGDSIQVTRTTTANSSGRVELALQMPSNAKEGRIQVAAIARGQQQGAYLSVVPLANLPAGAKGSTISIMPGRVFYAAGSGFQPGENVTLSVSFPLFNGSSVSVTKTVAIDAKGNFNATLIRIPTGVKQATIAVTATGQTSHKQATASAALAYHPSISLSSKTTRPGGSVTVNGSGFLPNSSVTVTLTAPNGGQSTVSVTQNATTNGSGAFSTALNVPANVSPGTYTVTATGSQTGASVSTKLTAVLSAAISVSPGKVSPGQTIKLTGGGFTPNVAVTVAATFPLYGGGHKTVSQTIGADAKGNISASIPVPGQAAAGTVTVTAKGPNTHASAKLSINHISAKVWVSPATTFPGGTITVHGSGYLANDTVDVSINIKMANGTTRAITATAHTGSNGGFVKQVNLPGDAAVGSYTITARSEMTGRAPTTRLTLSVHAGLSIKPGAAQPGHSITVTGGGFSAGATITVSATFPLYGGGSKTVSTTVQSNASGAITAHLTVPGKAASGPVSVVATGPNTRATAQLQIGKLGASVTASPASVIPGGSVQIKGSGYLANSKIDITVSATDTAGKARSLTTSATTNGNGQFTATLKVPGDIAGGKYTVTARSESSGRSFTTTLVVAKLAPSVVASPTNAIPGTPVTVNGFGFAAGESVTIELQNQKLGTATASGSGTFTLKVTVPSSSATGKYTLTAAGQQGHSAKIGLAINRQVSTHYYFASIYTGAGYGNYLDFLNPTEIQAQVTVTYMRKDGTTLPKTFQIAPHSRYTEDAGADLGTHVSASASVAADVPIIAERQTVHGVDTAIAPGAKKPGSIWYFANGNTSGKYREYIAVQNPNKAQVSVTFRILPTHHRAFNVVKTMAPTSRITIKVNKYVKDAVGVIVRSNGPVVANRTVFIHHGMSSKIGVNAPQTHWYFAAGPRDGGKHWIAAINPSGAASYVTLHAYDPTGAEVGTKSGWVKANGRVGYLINRIAHRTDVAVVLTASRPIVAEQMTYKGRMHDEQTDTFGVTAPAKSWGFASSNTVSGQGDVLDLFNPNLAPAPIVVQFMPTSGQVTERTYVVAPLAHQRVDVGSVMPNVQLGIVAMSNEPFVALNRGFINNHQGSDTSPGIPMG